MTAASRAPRAEPGLLIRPLRLEDLQTADAIRRLAFGTFLGLPDPMSFEGDANPVRTRYLADPTGCFAAELDGELAGTNFAVDWGSVGFFGPLTIHPDHWGRGIAQRLVEVALEAFAHRGTRHVGLFTFAHSPKHLALYQKFGFWPRFTTAIMSKPVGPIVPVANWSAYSELPAARQRASLEECRDLADAVHPGLDLGREITATARHRFGETVLLWDGGILTGFAVCHCGPDTEAGSGRCYIKFGAARPGSDGERSFAGVLAACEALAAARGLAWLAGGVNTARREAYRCMLRCGFRTDVVGVAMDRPDEAGYNRPDAYVIDDWM
ncbi:MAG: GCN5-related N-acetyltransferase [Geminicoccaceae bacterium]|nr:GCN5-related N-acetyltransferase [Geminicoccaceae bacterium]MDF3018284.1 GCN5-related N-acetyltransferase [Thermomicrobiales bacterium]